MAERRKRGRPVSSVPPRNQVGSQQGGYTTKSGDFYTDDEVKILREYAQRNAQALSSKGHQLEAPFRAALGLDGPLPRHTPHSVRGILRGMVLQGPFAVLSQTTGPQCGGARGGAGLLQSTASQFDRH